MHTHILSMHRSKDIAEALGYRTYRYSYYYTVCIKLLYRVLHWLCCLPAAR